MNSLLCEMDNRALSRRSAFAQRDQDLLDRERSWLKVNTSSVRETGLPTYTHTMHIHAAVERARQIIGE